MHSGLLRGGTRQLRQPGRRLRVQSRAAPVPRIRRAASGAPTNAGRPVASLYLKSKRVAVSAARWRTAVAMSIRAARAARVNSAAQLRATCAVYPAVGARRSRASPRTPTAGLSAMGAEAKSNAVAVRPDKPRRGRTKSLRRPARPGMHPGLLRAGQRHLRQGGRRLRRSHRLWHLLDARYLWRRGDRQHLWSPELRPAYLCRRPRELRASSRWLRRRARLRPLRRSPVVRRGRRLQPVWRRQLHTGHLRRGRRHLRAHRRWLREHIELRDLRGTRHLRWRRCPQQVRIHLNQLTTAHPPASVRLALRARKRKLSC